MKKILFISHDASRTGAPIVLLNFLEWLKNQNRFEITVFLRKGGALEDDFKATAPTYIAVEGSNAKKVFRKTISKIIPISEDHRVPTALLKQSFDLIYLNTVVCLSFAAYLKTVFNCPVVCHVHENEFSIKYYFSRFMAAKDLEKTDHFIAVSQSTADNLVKNYNVAPAAVSVVNAFVSIDKIKKLTISREVIRKELGLTDEFVVGGSGVTIWRKGPDLFVQLALFLNKLRPGNRIKLIWVGTVSHEFECQYRYEAGRLGIGDQIIFAGAKPNPQNYFQVFDVFALTSREDPFPLVAIEAAALQKPILCFGDSGGMPELIENDKSGIIVPYADVEEMAAQIIRLMDDKGLVQKMGAEAGKLMEKFDINTAGNQVLEVIQQLI